MRMSAFEIGAVRHVAKRMRASDREEIFATRWNDDIDPFLKDCEIAAAMGGAWVAHADEPVAVIGVSEMHPHVWSAWMFATDKFDIVGRMVTKFTVRVIIPGMLRRRAHRVECRTIASHATAHHWLDFLGGRREATLKKFGKNGEDFFIYASDLSGR